MNTTPHRPCTAAPLGIWPCDPAPGEDDRLPELAEHVTPAMLRRVLSEYGQPGDTVGLVGIDPAALPTTEHGGDFDVPALPTVGPDAPSTPPRPREGADGGPSGEQPATVGLIVAALADPSGCDPGSYQRWRRRLRPGGVLVALTTCPAGAVRFANSAGIVVAAATAAGLVYQQHIVAVHARIANTEPLAPPEPSRPDRGARAVQRPVHSDVLVFTNPAGVATEATR